MELNLNGESQATNGHSGTTGQPKQMRAELAGAVPIPDPTRHDGKQETTKPHCGYGLCHPLWLQAFASIKWFLATMSFYVLLQSLLVSGYTSSVITTIEKRYDLRSAESGLIVSSFDIGSLLVVVFISYFGGKGHRPRWVGIGAAVVSVGAVLFASPQFFSSPYDPSSSSTSSEVHEYLCSSNETSGNSSDDSPKCEAREASSLYIFLFVISNMIIGIGSTPIYTLGTTFIYDNSPREDSSLYIAIMYLMGAVGPAVGYVLGGAFISYYVDPGVEVAKDDPAFIGAWWSGYVLCAGLILLTSIPLLGFPGSLPKPSTSSTSGTNATVPHTPDTPVTTVTVSDDDDMNPMDASMNFGKNIKDLPRAIFSLLTNPTFLCITATATLEFSIVTAFLTFVPKYLQNQFGIDPSNASIYTGVVLVPSAGGGILLGGYVIKRLRLNMTGCAKVAMFSNIIAMSVFVAVFLISCPPSNIIGINGEPCSNCSCESTMYEPVCFNDVTFYNPCMAGCKEVKKYPNGTHVAPTVYMNCTCANTTDVGTTGLCERDCDAYFIPFMICLFVVTMATASAQTPALMVTLRCVKNDERPFAMGLQFVFFRALAYIPSPIYFGSAIDGACLIWRGSSDECEEGSGACQVYDADLFRYIYFGLAFSLKVASCFFVLLTWMMCRREYSTHSHTTKWRQERKNSKHERDRKREMEERYPSNRYGAVYGDWASNTGSSSLPGLDKGECSGQSAVPANTNNNNGLRPASITAVESLKSGNIQITTVSSSESESSVNSTGSQRPLMSREKSRNAKKNAKASNKQNDLQRNRSDLELQIFPTFGADFGDC